MNTSLIFHNELLDQCFENLHVVINVIYVFEIIHLRLTLALSSLIALNI